MKFSKMHGAGNDYIYVNCFKEQVDNPEELSIRLSHRQFGIGSDGLILIMPSQVADFRMRMFNNDGSEGKMCGNGTRCIGKYVYDNGLTDKTIVTLETLGGIKTLQLNVVDGKVDTVLVDMGQAILEPELIPVRAAVNPVVNMPLEIMGATYNITCVSMGNPHAVTFVPEVDNLDLPKIGPVFEHAAIFPERINTEFIKLLDKQNIQMRVWERGSGETLACGTGACASVVACVLNGYCHYDTPVNVHLLGGVLQVTYKRDGSVLMCGKATHVFDGEVQV